MPSISDVFRASASSVYDTFNVQMGVSSFRVPVYQRQYTWNEANINRLFEDIKEGLLALGSEEDYLTFLGTLVLVDEGNKKEQYFDGQSLSVVDGQQRLTTLALICCALFVELSHQRHQDLPDDPLASALREELPALCDSLFDCAVGHRRSHRPLERYDYFPRIVREEIDVRSASSQEANYLSPIADHLFRFSDYARSDCSTTSQSGSANPDNHFGDRVTTIGKLVNEVGNETVDADPLPAFPPTIELLENKKYRSVLFPKLQQRSNRIREVLEFVRHGQHADHRTLVRLVAFGNYLMQRVAITHVIAGDERYAFDIFEALNSTGEPLTAIETFKPNVIRVENRHSANYDDSPSKESLDIVESRVRRLDNFEEQQSESRELVVLLALYVSGKRLGLQLNSQRRYLRTTYEGLRDVTAKRRFVRALGDVAEYRSRYWDTGEIAYQLREAEDKEVALFCLRFIRDLRNSLTIPILCRYWIESQRRGDADEFIAATKAVTAFLVLRRAATGGTRAIDSDYRRIMSHGGMTATDGTEALMIGHECQEAQAPGLHVLRKYLRGYLRQSKVGIANKEEWVRRVSHQPLYRSGPALLCRFMLIVAAHNAIQDRKNGFLLTKGRANPEKDYMNLRSWQRDDFSTLEHVAPQRRSQGWDDSLYRDDNLVDYLGNLTLLPEKMNNTIGSKPWSKKSLFYRAAGAESIAEVRECIERAKGQGLDFGAKIVAMLESGACLSILSSVSGAHTWDAEIVQMRTKNIAELVWDELSGWLGWSEE